MTSRSGLWALVLLLAACKAAAPPAPALPAVAPSPVIAQVPAAPSTTRGPSDDVRKYWVFGDSVESALYADLGGLFATEQGKSLIPTLVTLGRGVVTAELAGCLEDVGQGGRELLIGKGGKRFLIILRFDESAARPDRCLAFAHATPLRFEGAPEAYRVEPATLVHLPGILLLGGSDAVGDALAQGSSARTPGIINLAEHQYLTWNAQLDRDTHTKGGLVLSPSLLRAEVDLDLPEQVAAAAALDTEKWKEAAPDLGRVIGMGSDWERVVRGVTATRRGRDFFTTLALNESAEDQVRDIGLIASVAFHGFAKYAINEKGSEARFTVRLIAQRYVDYWRSQSLAPGTHAPKKLVSFPRVPAAVPRGVTYQSTEKQWATWAPLKFNQRGAQSFQYEVEAAKDGLSADVIARGDLNGDGQTSLFKLHLTVSPETHDLSIAKTIDETNPEE